MNSRFASALLIACVASHAAGQTRVADSAVVTKALDEVRTFQRAWEREWMTGQRIQVARMNQLDSGVKIATFSWVKTDPFVGAPNGLDPRGRDLFCYFRLDDGPIYASDHEWGLPPQKRSIASQANYKHWQCPNWLPPDNYYLSGPDLPDERLSIDNALEPQGRARIAALRNALIRELALAARRVPRDSVLVGQYIRMLVDKGDYAAALVAVEGCRSIASWCLALRAYVSAKMGLVFDAEDEFLASLDSMPVSDACAFSGTGVLLDEDARKAYTRLPCEKQDSINQKIWWLADPLWSVPGNDRFVEQFVRRITIALHSALGRDERYNWISYGGGDALAEMIERYGWMSYTYGRRPLRLISELPDIYSRIPKDVATRRLAQRVGGWRTTHEYSVGRVHVIPPMAMVNDPFSITNADWSMNAPGGEWDFTFNWWPVEHYAPLNPLTKIVDQQTAFLRRQDSTLFAYATNLARTDLARTLGDSVTGVLFASTGPRAIRRLAEMRIGAQSRLTFLHALPAGPSVISVEIPWVADGDRGARSRFGARPPPPLSSMPRGAVAMSDPVLLIVPANTTALPVVADAAIALMNGSTTLAAGANSIGVYWETYGIAAGDSIDVTVSLQSRSGGSPVTSSWREPQAGRSVRTIAGEVPIQMRSLILDVGALPVGAYTLELSVRRQSGQLLRSAREITIR